MNIGIVGLGLIGGSLALDLRNLGHRIFGVSRRVSTCQLALDRAIVDEASTDLSLLAIADVIFVCTPIAAILPTVKELIDYLSPHTVVTDVGSVKTPIVEAITPLWPNFVGGHPMAGTAESGIEAAQFNLFADAPYITTPIDTTPSPALEVVENLARSLHSRIFRCSPPNHDQAVAWISHLPVMASASLIAACIGEPDPAVVSLAQHLASSGFRDTSRVGGGNPELGVMMAQYNRSSLLPALQSYRVFIDQFIGYIEAEDWEALETVLRQTQQARPLFLSPAKNN